MSTDAVTAANKVRELRVHCAHCGSDAGYVDVMDDGTITRNGDLIDQPYCHSCALDRRGAEARERIFRTDATPAEVTDPEALARRLTDMAFLIGASEKHSREALDRSIKALESRLTTPED